MARNNKAEADPSKEFEQIALEAGRVFTPATPVNEKELFAGRMEQIRRTVDAINTRGQHVVIFGERGVGKTSLGNVLSSKLTAPGSVVLAQRINCDTTDDFASLWRKIFSQVELIQQTRAVGFQGKPSQVFTAASEGLPKKITPEDVRKVLSRLSDNNIVFAIFDEFDRLEDQKARRTMADTIKLLSDHDIRATVIVIGVADTVDDLIAEHQSIERALVQIQMPRMSLSELNEILNKGTARLGMKIVDAVKNEISMLSQGLPHYAHLLGLHASRQALDSHVMEIGIDHVKDAIASAVRDTQQSLQSDYRKATTSPQKDNIYAQVLLACALAMPDDFGYFAAASVRGPLSGVMGKNYEIPSFAKHLNDFCQTGRGAVLKKSGVKHKFRYRFSNPLMQPLIIMKGLIDGRIDATALEPTNN